MSGIIHALKIVLLCFASAIVYGIVHDQFTVRLVERGLIALPAFIAQTPALVTSNFMADWWAHSASYAGGFFGGLVVCALVYRKRMHLGNTLERELVSN
jgi:hypothetical protein